MIASTKSQSEGYKGSYPSASPTNLPTGVFSFCSGLPKQGASARFPGKTLRDIGINTGGILSIYQFGTLVAVQAYVGLIIFDLLSLIPQVTDLVYDNEGNQVFDNEGLPVLAG